ncbi:MAG TPA: hypothetical protein PLK94_11195, partial [Alphaproteobacteria bacterium]|nr:hypothetical protein [Alphaproteobacteria bacterium]
FIEGPLPGLNDLIADAKIRNNRYSKYAKTKAKWTDIIQWAVIAKKMEPVSRAWFDFTWYENSRRRDPDNIAAAGRKLILDALTKAGIISNDGWSQVAGWSDTFLVDKDKPGVMVVVSERGS